jgi:serine/threonine protein kinase
MNRAMTAEAERSAGWVGTVLMNLWRVDAKIARGGVATVFRATNRRNGDQAAIKIMHPQYARNEDVRRRFLNEGYAANTVGHSDVVRVLDHNLTSDNTPFLVMELLENGENLEERRERLGGRLPAHEVLRISDLVLDVLATAHEKGIIHRDIKPDNIFVKNAGTKDVNIKVLDFGIAHIKEAALKHEPTATGLLLGTPEFMAPEQAMGRRGFIDAQTDLYALGATMFTLLSGEAVHVHDVLSALLIAAASKQARSLGSVAFKKIPREAIEVVDKAISLEKARRYPNARAMQTAVREALAKLPKEEGEAVAAAAPAPAIPAGAAAKPKPPIPTPPKPTPAVRSLPPVPRPALDRPPPPSGRAWPPATGPASDPTMVKAPRISIPASVPPSSDPTAIMESPKLTTMTGAELVEEESTTDTALDMRAPTRKPADAGDGDVEDLPTQTSLPSADESESKTQSLDELRKTRKMTDKDRPLPKAAAVVDRSELEKTTRLPPLPPPRKKPLRNLDHEEDAEAATMARPDYPAKQPSQPQAFVQEDE